MWLRISSVPSVPRDLGEVEPEQLQRHELRRERLRRRHADFRAGVRVHGAVGVPGDRAADDVADGDAAGALARGFVERRPRIRGLARLGDDDGQLVGRDDRVAIAVLRAVLDFDRHLRQRLDHVLADEPRVPRRAARQDGDLAQVLERVGRDVQILEEDLAAVERDAPEDGVAGRGGLLVDLLEHEVLVAALLRRDRIPQHALAGLRHLPARVVGEHDARAGDHRHLFVAEEHHVARVRQDGRDVGRHEELVVTEADHDRRAVADRHDLLGVVHRHQHQREHAAHHLERAPDGVLQAVGAHLAFDEVRDDLGVGLGLERVALALQFAFQLEIVLDDAVVHHDDLAGAVTMRMRVLFGGPAVRRPARVAHAVDAVERLDPDRVLEVGELPRRAAQLDALGAHERHARRVVAAVFHAPQPVQQHGHDGLRTDVSDDPAHTRLPYPFCVTGFLRSAQPSTLACRARAMPSAPAGTSSTIEEPAPT